MLKEDYEAKIKELETLRATIKKHNESLPILLQNVERTKKRIGEVQQQISKLQNELRAKSKKSKEDAAKVIDEPQKKHQPKTEKVKELTS